MIIFLPFCLPVEHAFLNLLVMRLEELAYQHFLKVLAIL